MRKTAILVALACAFARADYGPGTTDSDLLRSGTPVVTNAWLAVSNETANFVRSVAGNKITDGTNTIDAARNVYLVYENCWIRRDGYVLTYIGDGTWKSIKETPYGYIYLDERSPGEWYETVIAIPDIFYRDGDTLTNETGMVMYRYGSAQIPVGRLALTNDIPSVVSADLTPATNYANQVSALVAREATNYTDAVAAEFEDGQRIPQYANNSGHSDYATELYDENATATYNATDLIRESTNAAISVSARKQDALPYPTNAIPYAAISGTPTLSGYATRGQVAEAAVASTNYTDGAISTNNAAFVAAVTNCPVSHQGGGGADWPIGDFGQYGTIGAIIAALVAAVTWLKSHLRYELHDVVLTGGAGTLLDRAGNRVVVTGDTTLTLPALEDAGKARDFLVRLEISGSTVPTITFQGQGDEDPYGAYVIGFETDGDTFPVPDEAGNWIYSFTETVAHTFAVSLKKVNFVEPGGS